MMQSNGVVETENSYLHQRSRVALLAIVVLCLVGIGIAVELTSVYVMSRTDPTYQSFCAVSDGMNCETVSLSKYSEVLGSPVSVWAVAGYAFVALLALALSFHRREPFGFGLLFAMAVVFLLVSLALIYIMAFLIHSLCILCLAVDFINVGILIMAWIALGRTGRGVGESVMGDIQILLSRPAITALVGIVGIGVLAGAWAYGSTLVPKMQQTLAKTAQQEECVSDNTDTAQSLMQMGINELGHPWMGAKNPQLEIQEFTDYQCPHCRRSHMMARQLLSDYPGQIRIYHRHLPLDQSCNPSIKRLFHDRACEFSRIAVCAGKQGRFWEMNDFLFQHSMEIASKSLTAEQIAARLELNADAFNCCMRDPKATAIVDADIAEGNQRDIKGTPAFLIGDTLHYGRIPEPVIQELLSPKKPKPPTP